MLKSVKLKKEMDSKKAMLGKLSEGTEGWRKLTLEFIKLAKECAEAVVIEAEQKANLSYVDGEDFEKRDLLSRASVGDFIKALMEHKPVTGASAEARAAFGCMGEYEIPLELFEPADKQKAVTPAPADRPVVIRPAQPYLYSRTEIANAGIDLPLVGAGEQGFAVMTTPPPAAPKAKDADAPATASAITVHKSSVKRITGQYTIRVEDVSQFPQLEETLRVEIPRSIANTMDQQLLAGSGSDPELKSIFSLLVDPTADTTTETFESFISTITGKLDGIHANELADIRSLVGMKTYEVMTSLFATNTAVSAADYLHSKIGGLRASKRITAPATDNQQGLVRLGDEPMCAVAPLWGGVQLIDDPYTNAAKGQRTITAYQLISDVLMLRPAAFAQVDFHLA